MTEEEPILFFRELKEPGNVNIFATLKDALDLVAKKKKPYLRLVLVDPSNKELYIQIWSNNEIYAPVNMYLRKNLLHINGPIHLKSLSYDGEYVGSTKESKINTMPTQHPVYAKYIALNNYRLLKTIPEDSKILSEIHKLLNIKPLIEAILTRLKDKGLAITEELFWEITKIICDKTYTGTIHLIAGKPQLEITPQYSDYVLKQLKILLIAFERDIANDRVAPIILIRRLQKDLVSLYDFTEFQNK
ncbi:MAG: hypothetical protein KAJ76_06370 [Candidatus Heimdallarchaeota archaeon]|nr:hypothetical protein [Candidatus Heimdallarchaeota archaeon]